MRDPLGHDTTIAYDRPYHLLPQQVTDAVGLTTSAEYDYRVLQPRMATNANGNRRAVSFSPLGLVTVTAVMGEAGEQAGDTIEAPGSRLEYDFFAFMNRQQPVFVRGIVRQHHVTETDVPLPQRDETIQTVEYSDGFGRLLQTRTQAEDVLFGDPSFGGGVLSADQSTGTGDAVGRRRTADDPANVIVSGWQVYDNKGRVVERYEPFFAVGLDYGAPSDAQFGQKATMFYDPRGQVIRTLNPDGSEQRVVYGIPADLADPEQFAPTPWEAYTYDANDLAPVSFHPTDRLPDGSPKPLTDRAPAAHHFTPSSIVIDALGRTVLAVARNRDAPDNPGDPLPSIQEIRTQSTYDIGGNVLTVTDALDRVAFRYAYDLANRPWRIESIDAGLRRIVLNVLGNETERRDSKGALILQAYDRLQRPIRLWARDDTGSPITLRQRMEYGDAGTPNQSASERAAMRARNLLGQILRHHDEAGLTAVAAVDFKGNVLDKSRRVIADAPILAVFEQGPANAWQITPFRVDWQPRPQQTLAEREGELLETTAYRTTASYDALNRIKRMQFPQDVEGRRRELRPEYNRAGGLEQVWLDNTLYVERIAYDAKGQRALIAYGNGVMTRYAYDPQTFRLKRLRSERYSKPDDISYHPGGAALQDFGYDYDLAGNILRIRDRAPGSGIPNNPEALAAGDPVLAQLLVSGNALNRRFAYDSIYRLLSATGRECDHPPEGPPWDDQPRCTDLTRSRAYSERYAYDAMGNMLRLEHRNEPGGFTREFTVETANNRLREMKVGDSPFAYTFDANGNMRSETTSRHFEWNHSDQMKAYRTQTEGAEPSVHAHYLYDAAGQRLKKLVRKQGGQVEVTHYIDAVFEHHRWGSGVQAGENNHVHVMDDMQRIGLVRLGAAHPDERGPGVQFHLGDHLGSSNVIVDSGGAIVSREECTPYGETSFGSFARKRYRFTGKERDEESGLNYHGARYLAPFVARWISCDPAGPIDGSDLYCYSRCNPLTFKDVSGLDSQTATSETIGVNTMADPLEEKDPNLFWVEHEGKSTRLLHDVDTGQWFRWQDNAWQEATEQYVYVKDTAAAPKKSWFEQYAQGVYNAGMGIKDTAVDTGAKTVDLTTWTGAVISHDLFGTDWEGTRWSSTSKAYEAGVPQSELIYNATVGLVEQPARLGIRALEGDLEALGELGGGLALGRIGHRNSLGSNYTSTLYQKFTPSGGAQGHQKFGKSWNPSRRYTRRQLGGDQVQGLVKGPHARIHALERYLTERFKGPLTREPWAGSVKVRPDGTFPPSGATKPFAWFSRDAAGNAWVGPVELGHLTGPSQL